MPSADNPADVEALHDLLRYGRKHEGPWDEGEGSLPDEGDAHTLLKGYNYIPNYGSNEFVIKLTDDEQQVLFALADEQHLPPWKVLVNALRIYQTYLHPVERLPKMSPLDKDIR